MDLMCKFPVTLPAGRRYNNGEFNMKQDCNVTKQQNGGENLFAVFGHNGTPPLSDGIAQPLQSVGAEVV